MTTVYTLLTLSNLFACLGEFESGNDDTKVGRVGEVSRFQIRPDVWRVAARVPLSTARKPSVALAVAWRVQSPRVATFQAIYGRAPTPFEFYALWNAPDQVYRRRISSRVAARATRFANLVGVGQPQPSSHKGI